MRIRNAGLRLPGVTAFAKGRVGFAVQAAVVIALLGCASHSEAAAQNSSAPTSSAAAASAPAYTVTGFRDANFGMSEQEVRAAIQKDFGLKPADITSASNPIEGTTVLTAKVPSLDPGPGPATVAYILGYTSKKLIQVNVAWGGNQQNSQTDSNTIVASGTRLERYFAGYSWSKDTTRAGIPVGPNTVVLFSGEDGGAGAVQLILDGVKYQMQSEGKESTTSPDPKGPAKLVINYIANRDNPDVAKIEKGKF
jgi:hypothetical protein